MKLYIIIAVCIAYAIAKKIELCPGGCGDNACCVNHNYERVSCEPLRKQGEECYYYNITKVLDAVSHCSCAEGLQCLPAEGNLFRCMPKVEDEISQCNCTCSS